MKDKAQFQKGFSLGESMAHYGTEGQCRLALFQWRWPQGYACPGCGGPSHCTLETRAAYQCNRCHRQHSPVSGTIFSAAKLPLTTWFLAARLVAQAKTGLPALSLRRQSGVSYDTAWGIKQELTQVMKERDDSGPLSGIIQLDGVYWGAGRRGGGRGRGPPDKIAFVAAVPANEKGRPIAMDMNVVNGSRPKETAKRAKRHVSADSPVVPDGPACFAAVAEVGCQHIGIVTGGGPEPVSLGPFAWADTVTGDVKRSINGACHAIGHKHPPAIWQSFVIAPTDWPSPFGKGNNENLLGLVLPCRH
jgi:hypothetical protein